MKNRIYKFLFTLFFTCLFSNSQSDELNINASEVKVDSVSKIIFAQGNVEISDNKNNLIKSDEAEYDKAKEILKAIGKASIITSENYEVSGSDIFYDKQKIIYSQNETIITDTDGNKVFVNMFNYLTEKKCFYQKEILGLLIKEIMNIYSQKYILMKKKKDSWK